MWSSGERRARRRPIAVLAGAALLAATAVLTGPGPLVGSAAGQSAPGVPSPQPKAPPALTATGAVADLVVSVSVNPNRPGPAAFVVTVTSSRRPPPAPITGVRLAVSGRTVPLAAVAAGQYAGSGRLVRPGPVRAAVVIVRSGARLDVPLDWSVGPAAPIDTPAVPPAGSALGGLGLLWAVLVPPLLGALVLAARRLRRSGRGGHPDPAGAAVPRPAAPAGTSAAPDAGSRADAEPRAETTSAAGAGSRAAADPVLEVAP